MARRLRNALLTLVPIVGIAWSLPMHTGRTEIEPGLAAYSAADPALFSMTAHRGHLALAGHTASTRHEERLKLAAAEHFPGQPLRVDFRPLGAVPAWWDDATAELIAALATAWSSSARLGEDSLHVRAVVANRSATELRLQSLRKALPESANVDVRLVDVDSTTPAAAVCDRHFAAHESAPVNFEESGAELRTSAYAVLDRIVTLADACRDSMISITGHTDSSGDETWNLQLSLARARTVAGYLGQRGIDTDRLNIAGVGSSLPIADNATRYGRGINRRIEITLSSRR